MPASVRLKVDDRLGELDLPAELERLPASRRATTLKLVRDVDRRASVAAYRLLVRLLGEVGIGDPAPEFRVSAGGRPELKDHPEWHFSLSHCHLAAAAALAAQPVGVDVEAIAPVDAAVAERVLSAAEQRRLRQSAEPEVEFARLWTRKEALLKLRGTGIVSMAELPGLLEATVGVELLTRVCRDRGYVMSVATGCPE